MPSQHAPDKVCVSSWVPRTLQRKLKRLATDRDEDLTELVEGLYTKATSHIELTPDDYHQIAKETEEARKRIDRRTRAARAAGKTPKGS